MKLHFCGFKTVFYHRVHPIDVIFMGAGYNAMCSFLDTMLGTFVL